MTFVNEYISEEDKTKHNISSDNHFYRAGTTEWTVDKESNSFLMRRTGVGPESTPGETSWAFFWRGHLLDVRLRLIDAGGDPRGGHGWEHVKLLAMKGVPPELEQRRAEILKDLKEALTAHKGLGVLSRRISYEVFLDK